MKVVFKKRKKRTIKISYLLILFLINIIFVTSMLLKLYLSNLTPKMNEMVMLKLEKVVYKIINDQIGYSLEENSIKNIFLITKNNNGEIISVDYDLKRAYIINNSINNNIKKSLQALEDYELETGDFKNAKNGVYIDVPLFIASDYAIISNLGPKIPIKINFIDSIKSNLKTKVTSYGLNNALSEIFVEITINELITTPVNKKKLTINYEFLIDAAMINGRVPLLYGNDIVSKSNIIDIPID